MSAQQTLPPYAEALGIVIDHDEAGEPVLRVEFSTRVQGRPGFLHGGAMSGLMEMAAFAALRAELAARGEASMQLKPVNIQVEFMRGGTEQVTYAKGTVTRAGRRVALVNAEAWQDDRTKPIALAQIKVLLIPAE
ncbi:PaaI family thioesterase [Novosphingobium sp.]|uniref:PaaI family thioesterase n=1 Tax=Novosphingobium sp. TaxID=1874826 RepID=UPI0022C138E9|nr:PaaI family thioesterase [Novosphingobium sp.]MCZ8019777.1 PaaI family thioesterase [Novosphingobium sp.]MCZ8035897.1 PaaI family thioesterase [Novosphingobium sp.]MCZ8052774.1 PaaI family thioesterase [Novosphingobium sp.]MCZ8060879.1 PaaI family thioesterase [Novosphingobium sp.]MCZ8233450.1 PaaI family thioesterase [Novosphingobium sp.]